MGLKLANNAFSTLAGSVSDSATTLSVQSGHAGRFPSMGGGDFFYGAIANAAGAVEIVKVTGRSGAVLTIERGEEGTAAAAWNSGDSFSLRLTKETLRVIANLEDVTDAAAARALLGMDQVNNTSDADKPVSDATTAAIAVLAGLAMMKAQNLNDVADKPTARSNLSVYSRAEVLERMPAGAMIYWPKRVAPAGWFERDGATFTRASYPDLWAALHDEATVTITIASPAVVSWTGHGLAVGDVVRFYTTGALPTGLTANTNYYVISSGFGSNSFRISTSSGGSAVNTSGSQSGVHTCVYAPSGHGNGSTTATLPDDRGNASRGWDHGRGTLDTGRLFGSEQLDDFKSHDHSLTMDAYSGHAHSTTRPRRRGGNGNSSNSGWDGGDVDIGPDDTWSTNTAGGFTPSGDVGAAGGTETRMRNRAWLPIIKYN